jgi:hypothetical protein
MSVFLIFSASSSERPLTRSVMYELLAIAEPQPYVLNLTSEMTPCSSTRICSFITSPHLCGRQRGRGRVGKDGGVRGGADEAGADVRVSLGHRANLCAHIISDMVNMRRWRAGRAYIPRVLVVRDDLFVVGADKDGLRERAGRCAEGSLGKCGAEHGRRGVRARKVLETWSVRPQRDQVWRAETTASAAGPA